MSTHVAKPEDLLPLNPVDFQVLLVLVEGDSHGYAIVKEMRTRTNGQIDLLPGNFYTILQRLLRAGLIADVGLDPDSNSPGRPRRLYRLTDFGVEVASAEAARLRDLVAGSAVRALAAKARIS